MIKHAIYDVMNAKGSVQKNMNVNPNIISPNSLRRQVAAIALVVFVIQQNVTLQCPCFQKIVR